MDSADSATFIVMSPGRDQIVIVSGNVKYWWLTFESGFRGALSAAVTDWVLTAPEGKKAFEATGGQLCLIDLVSFMGSGLRERAEKQGIYDLSIVVVSAEDSGKWRIDDCLFDPRTEQNSHQDPLSS